MQRLHRTVRRNRKHLPLTREPTPLPGAPDAVWSQPPVAGRVMTGPPSQGLLNTFYLSWYRRRRSRDKQFTRS